MEIKRFSSKGVVSLPTLIRSPPSICLAFDRGEIATVNTDAGRGRDGPQKLAPLLGYRNS